MAKNRRVVFTFDEPSLRALEVMTEEGNYDSMADTVRESEISRALQTQAKQGFWKSRYAIPTQQKNELSSFHICNH